MEHQRPDRLQHQRAEVRLHPRELARDDRLAAAQPRRRAAAPLMLPAAPMAENVARSRGSRQGNGQSPTVRA